MVMSYNLPRRAPTNQLNLPSGGGIPSNEEHAFRHWDTPPTPDAQTLTRTAIENTIVINGDYVPFPDFDSRNKNVYNVLPLSGEFQFKVSMWSYIRDSQAYDLDRSSKNVRASTNGTYYFTIQQLNYFLRSQHAALIKYLTECFETRKLIRNQAIRNNLPVQNNITEVLNLFKSEHLFHLLNGTSAANETLALREYPQLKNLLNDALPYYDMHLIKNSVKPWGVSAGVIDDTHGKQTGSFVVKGDNNVKCIFPSMDKAGLELAFYLVKRTRYSHSQVVILPMGMEFYDEFEKFKQRENYPNTTEYLILGSCGIVQLESESSYARKKRQPGGIEAKMQGRSYRDTTRRNIQPGDVFSEYEETENFEDVMKSASVSTKLSRLYLTRRYC